MIDLRRGCLFQAKRLLQFSSATGRMVLPMLLATLFMLGSCGKDPAAPVAPPGPGPDPEEPEVPTVEYLQFVPTSAKGMTITLKSQNQYELVTTSQDPYASTEPLKKSLHADSVVLTFEYQSTDAIDFLQLFFANPMSETRSTKTTAIPKAARWKSWSVNLKNEIKKHSWGSAGDYLRMDFGEKSGITLLMRNIRFRGMTPEEIKQAEEEANKAEAAIRFEANLKTYLGKTYSSVITNVKATTSKITIMGRYTGDGEYSLCEIPPYVDVTEAVKFNYQTPLTSTSFSVDQDRYVTRDGIKYDRALSKWAVVKNGATKDELVSHARYADEMTATQSMVAMKPASQKGLGGFFLNQFESDLDDLGITSITVNVPLTGYMSLQPRGNSYSHTYGGKTYYFDKGQIDRMDATLKAAQKRNIVVAAIILIQKASECADAEVGKLLQHPNFTSNGIYTMPNMSNPESVNCYAAGLDFLAQRYCRSDNAHGRIHHWIMHNEVDIGYDWTNMGKTTIGIYTDTYMKSMRMCHNIVRQYDATTEIFGSFAHSWAKSLSEQAFPTKDMLSIFNAYSKAEGDFQWAVAFHSYPQDLNEPKTWMDKDAKYAMSTPLVSFKNLEVLDKWIKKPENLYKGMTKRSLWLSENGTNSRSYAPVHLEEQAAGFAYAWIKIAALDGIDGIQWHNWIDNSQEYGLRIGLRRFPEDPTNPAGPKEVWFAYKAAGTATQEAVFEPYRKLVGVPKWEDILQPFILDN